MYNKSFLYESLSYIQYGCSHSLLQKVSTTLLEKTKGMLSYYFTKVQRSMYVVNLEIL